jgi:CubicO group peptidase (beta-lactamase class C family)
MHIWKRPNIDHLVKERTDDIATFADPPSFCNRIFCAPIETYRKYIHKLEEIMKKNSMHIRTALVTLFFLLSHPGLAKELQQSDPETVGMSSARLQRIEEMNRNYIEEGKLAGIATMVAREGKIIHLDAAGTLGLEDPRPITKDTLFRIYSMTKPITAVALMMLYEEGAFQLKDPVSKFLPEFDAVQIWTAEGNIEPQGPITMHHLLTHTSGLSYGFIPDSPVDALYREAAKKPAQNLNDHITKLTQLPLLFEPGERWHYSVASDVLGAVIENISGLGFDEFLRQRLFDPLGMENTYFSVPKQELDRLAENLRWDRQQNKLANLAFEPSINPSYTDVSLFLGGQGLVSTIGDYMKFAQMLLNGGTLGEERFLSPKTIEFITQNHLGGISQVSGSGEAPAVDLQTTSKGTGFGLGFGVITEPIQAGVMVSGGTYFWGGAAGTIFWIDPVEDLIGIAMMQLMGSPWPFREELMVRTYQAITELHAAPQRSTRY